MLRFTRSPALLLATGLLAVLPASAQLTTVYRLDFNTLGDPWASTGTSTMTGTDGTPTLQNTDLAPGAGNLYSAVFDGSQYQHNTTFAGLDPLTTGYGIQVWVKSPGSNFPSGFWLNIASIGFPTDSGQPLNENGITIGLFEGEYYGGSNRSSTEPPYGFPAVQSTIAPGGAGSINGWDHLAFVADGSTGRFYVNGVLEGTLNTTFYTPSSAWHLFAGLDGYPAYTGLADDLELFTFATGTFNASSLAYASAVPEPSAYAALAGLAALGLTVVRRRLARQSLGAGGRVAV